MRIHIGAAALVIAAIIVSFAAPASAQSPELEDHLPRSTYDDPLPSDVAFDRYNRAFRGLLVRNCYNVTTQGTTTTYTPRVPQTAECAQLFPRLISRWNGYWISVVSEMLNAFDYNANAPLGTYGVGLCTDLVTGEDRTIGAVPEGRRWHAWSSGTLCWDRNDDGDFDDAGEIGSLLMDE